MLKKKNQNQLLTFSLLVAVLGIAAFVWWPKPQPSVEAEVLKVSASFYALAEFVRQIGGDFVDVTVIIPDNTEPHDYEPTPQQVAKIYDADLFIYNGSGFDPWAEQLAPQVQAAGVRTINLSETKALLPSNYDIVYDRDGNQAKNESQTQPAENLQDPHFWLDPVLAQELTAALRDELIAIDPAHADRYRATSAAFIQQLDQLDQDYRTGLLSCRSRTVIAAHNAFGYLAKRYNLSIIAIAGLSPEEEPSSGALADIVELAREQNIEYIFFETLVSTKLAETVADELGAQTLVFNPIEGLTEQQSQSGENYFSLMRANLHNLRTALKCN